MAEMPEFRSTGGQTGRETEKAGMESGRRNGGIGVEVGVDEKMEILPKVFVICCKICINVR